MCRLEIIDPPGGVPSLLELFQPTASPMLRSNPASAYLLVSHGSRDPRPEIAIEHLARSVAQRLQRMERVNPVAMGTGQAGGSAAGHPLSDHLFPLMGTAVLELAPLPLHQQVQQFAKYAHTKGYRHVQILPLFLLPGVHVMEDIPAEVQMAQQSLGTELTLEICPYLGSHPGLSQLLINPVDPVATTPTMGKVLLSHGSRRSQGNQLVEEIATQLGATAAFWSVAPDLETQLTKLVKQGYQQITILPYFLFDGGITDAITQEVKRLGQQFPYVQLHLSRPIGATPQLADLLVDLLLKEF